MSESGSHWFEASYQRGKLIDLTLWPQLLIFVISLFTLLGFWIDNLIGLHMIPLMKRLQ